MIMAIAVLVVLATIMALTLQLNKKTSKTIIDTYVENQAELYAKNGAEYALYLIATSGAKCSPTTIAPFTIDGLYTVHVDLSYAYSNAGTCTKTYIDLKDAPTSAREYGYVRIDVSVDVNKSSINSEPIRIFRRYIEDITPYLH